MFDHELNKTHCLTAITIDKQFQSHNKASANVGTWRAMSEPCDG